MGALTTATVRSLGERILHLTEVLEDSSARARLAVLWTICKRAPFSSSSWAKSRKASYSSSTPCSVSPIYYLR